MSVLRALWIPRVFSHPPLAVWRLLNDTSSGTILAPSLLLSFSQLLSQIDHHCEKQPAEQAESLGSRDEPPRNVAFSMM